MSTEGPETSEEKIKILLDRIQDAEREFGITLRNYNRVTNMRLKRIAEERLNMLLLGIMKYAVEGMPKDYIRPYPLWIRNNQDKINGWLQSVGISASTAKEVKELNNSVMNPNAAPPRPQAHAAPEPDAFRAQQQARERAQRDAQERAQREAQEERERQEHEASPEVVANRKREFESVINDPEAILKNYKSILGIKRMQAKLSTKGKDSRSDIDNIVKLFTILKNDHETDWNENAKAAYCYVKEIYRKYDVGMYGKGYEKKYQDPVADACFNYMQTLAKAVTSDYGNVDNIFRGNVAHDYVRRCEEKLQNFDNESRSTPKRR